MPHETAPDYTVRHLNTVTDAELQDLSDVLIECVARFGLCQWVGLALVVKV